MTSTILSIIGILLAALSTLIVMDYGGDFFVESRNRAEAATVSNAGANVKAAYQVFESHYRRPPASLGELLETPAGSNILVDINRGDPGVAARLLPQWQLLDRGRGSERAFVIAGISETICGTLNRRLNNFAEASIIPTNPAFADGCIKKDGSNVYYAFLGMPPA